MNVETTSNKSGRFGLYNLAHQRIKECENVKGKTISFPSIFQKLCRSFSISKKEAWELLRIMVEFDLIEIIPFKGVKIKDG